MAEWLRNTIAVPVDPDQREEFYREREEMMRETWGVDDDEAEVDDI